MEIMDFKNLNNLLSEFHKKLGTGEHVFISPEGDSIFAVDFAKGGKPYRLAYSSDFQTAPIIQKGYFMKKVEELTQIKHTFALTALEEAEKVAPKIELIKPL